MKHHQAPGDCPYWDGHGFGVSFTEISATGGHAAVIFALVRSECGASETVHAPAEIAHAGARTAPAAARTRRTVEILYDLGAHPADPAAGAVVDDEALVGSSVGLSLLLDACWIIPLGLAWRYFPPPGHCLKQCASRAFQEAPALSAGYSMNLLLGFACGIRNCQKIHSHWSVEPSAKKRSSGSDWLASRAAGSQTGGHLGCGWLVGRFET